MTEVTAHDQTDFADDERPWTLNLAIRLIVVMIIAGAFTLVLLIIRHDDLITVWAQGNPAVREILETRGLQAVKDGSIPPPRFIPVGITEFIVLAGLTGILAVFLRNGFEWARIGITLLLFFAAVAGIAGFRVGQPGVFTVCAVGMLVLAIALMVPLWHPLTTAYIHPREPDPLER